jgi:hypothetical protein
MKATIKTTPLTMRTVQAVQDENDRLTLQNTELQAAMTAMKERERKLEATIETQDCDNHALRDELASKVVEVARLNKKLTAVSEALRV